MAANLFITTFLLILSPLASSQQPQSSGSDVEPPPYYPMHNAKPFMPIYIPLAVKSPYHSTWFKGGDGGGNLATDWPVFWTGEPVGWAGLVRVDGRTWGWMGRGETQWEPAKNISFEFTSTKTMFVQEAGPIRLTSTFLSPILPSSDLISHSLPFSYLHIALSSLDSKPHKVELYSDISGEWVSGDSDSVIEWGVEGLGRGRGKDGGEDGEEVLLQRLRVKDQLIFEERNDMAQYGEMIWATKAFKASPDKPHEIETTHWTGGSFSEVRARFIQNGSLPDIHNKTYRAVNDDWPIFAFSHDLGLIGPDGGKEVMFVTGHVRDPIVQYVVGKGNAKAEGQWDAPEDGKVDVELRESVWLSRWKNTEEALLYFFDAYKDNLRISTEFDKKIIDDATKAHSKDYADLCALSVRQVFHAFELTRMKDGKDGKGDANGKGDGEEDVMGFMKEISSNGNCNTIDVIFPASPIFLYLSPEYLSLVLKPIFRYHQSGMYLPEPAIHDLGDHYPNVTGHNEYLYPNLPIEECGNMLIMMLAMAQVTGDTKMIKDNYSLLKLWADWLVDDCLIPAKQHDFAGRLANQTNLALKGIIGIGAMSEISALMNEKEDQKRYKSVANSYVPQFLELAMSKDGDHAVLNYGNDSSWSTLYNLYADRLLNLNMFPETFLDMQDEWYLKVADDFGPPLDSRSKFAKSDWQVFAAGAAKSGSRARDFFVESVVKYTKASKNNVHGDLFLSDTGWSVGFKTRPVVGGHFALVALSTLDSARSSYVAVITKHLKKIDTGLGLIALGFAVVVLAGFYLWNRIKGGERGVLRLGGLMEGRGGGLGLGAYSQVPVEPGEQEEGRRRRRRTSSIELGNRGRKGGGPTHLRKGSGHYNGPSHGGHLHVHVDRGEVKRSGSGSGSGGGSGYGSGEGTPMLRGIDETGTHFVIDDEE